VKNSTCLLLLFLAAISFSTSCERDGGPGKLNLQTYRNLKKVHGRHPRLLLTGKEEERLRQDISTSHQWLWDRYLDDLPEKIARAGQNIDQLNRGHGNLASDLAFAWRITGSDSLFEQTKKYLFKLCDKEIWDPDYDLLHGHLLLGVALAYDWLYPRLNRAQRSLVASKLGDEAQMQYEMVAHRRAWYRNQYLQNHGHVNFGGLAYAGVALYGEDARAQDWLAACENFFARVFELSPPDGTSIEGLSYGNYALEFCLYYAEIARSILGRDYFGSPWLANYHQYLLHSLLPAPAENEWAMTFGDSPRHGNSHGPEPQLFLLASRFNYPEAQWLGRRLIELRDQGLGSASWWSLLWYDPDIRQTTPASSQTLKEFSDIGQVMIRSSWQDKASTMIGIKCGPFMGKAQTIISAYDLGAAHGHPDAGSFQLYSHGRFLAIDPGYTYFKKTVNHNTLIVKGMGQLGDEEPWFAAAEAIRFRHLPRIVESRSTGDYDYVLADLAPAYHPALGLKKALRHFLFLKPDLLLIVDQITLDNQGVVFSYPADSLKLTGALRHDGGYVVGTRGQAFFNFEGSAGEYSIAASYIDNSPLSGSYNIFVGNDTVHSWQDTVEITDTHLEITPEVELSSGSRIFFNAEPMGKGARLIKLSLYGPEIPAERDVRWLLHFEPEAVIQRHVTRIEGSVGDVSLDIYPLAPPHRNHDWGKHRVIEGLHFKETVRLEIRPVFTDSSTTMLTLLHARQKSVPAINWLSGDIYGNKARLRWYRNNKSFVLDFDLEKRVVILESK